MLQESHGQRSLAGYSPWVRKELDTTEQLTLSFSKRVDNEGLTVGFALSPTQAQRGPRLYVYHNVSHLHTFIRQSGRAEKAPAGTNAETPSTPVVQSLSCVRLFVTSRTAAHQASLSSTVSRSLLRFLSIESVMPSNHLILCGPFFCCLQSFPASGSFPMSQLFSPRWPKSGACYDSGKSTVL